MTATGPAEKTDPLPRDPLGAGAYAERVVVELSPGVMRRILILTSLAVFADALFFSVLTPVLPHYVADLDLSESQAGVLSGAYAWGSVAAALPAGFLAQRFGPRPVVCVGLVVLSAATIGFAWGTDIIVLDAARFVQGIAGAVVWSGAITWLIAATPSERRGEVIGRALFAGGAGALVGPAVGAAAASLGTGEVFTASLILTIPLCYLVARIPETHRFDHQPVREVVAALSARPVLTSVLFLAIPALAFGFIVVLVPLKMNSLGGGANLIAASFISAGIIEAVLGPMSGRWSDRVGRRTPYVCGIAVLCIGLAGQAASESLVLFVGLYLVGVLGAGLFISPALAALSDAGDRSGLAQSHVMATCNTVLALGLAAGSLFGGTIAGVAGLNSPFVMIAVVLALLGLYATRALTSAPPKVSAPGD